MPDILDAVREARAARLAAESSREALCQVLLKALQPIHGLPSKLRYDDGSIANFVVQREPHSTDVVVYVPTKSRDTWLANAPCIVIEIHQNQRLAPFHITSRVPTKDHDRSLDETVSFIGKTIEPWLAEDLEF